MRYHAHANEECIYLDYKGKAMDLFEIGCPEIKICKKIFNVSFVKIPPFSFPFSIEKVLKSCCGSCGNYKVINEFENITEVTPSSINTSDFVLPFLASATTERLYGYHFIPFFDVTDAIYVTERGKLRLFQSILELYPLMIICLLLAVIAGFFAWILETWTNIEEFPRDFLTGWFEGFWWSFITMTTVGYGDKSPQTFVGRLFSILWIFVGLISCGILTASLTTEIMNANSPPPPDMKGSMVGSLQYRDYEQLIIAKNGGVLVETEGIDFYSDLILLIEKLQKKEIDGFLLDKYTLHFSTLMLDFTHSSPSKFRNQTSYPISKEVLDEMIDYFTNNTVRTEMSFGTENLSYGILVKNTADYEYFRHVITDNRLRNKIDYDLNWNRIKRQFAKNKKDLFYSAVNILFSPYEYYFQHSIITIGIILLIICLFGMSYELSRKSVMQKVYSRLVVKAKIEEEESFLTKVKAMNPAY